MAVLGHPSWWLPVCYTGEETPTFSRTRQFIPSIWIFQTILTLLFPDFHSFFETYTTSNGHGNLSHIRPLSTTHGHASLLLPKQSTTFDGVRQRSEPACLAVATDSEVPKQSTTFDGVRQRSEPACLAVATEANYYVWWRSPTFRTSLPCRCYRSKLLRFMTFTIIWMQVKGFTAYRVNKQRL